MKFLRNLSISKKLLIIIIASALGLCSIGTLGISYINEMAKGSNVMYKDNLLHLNKIMQIRVNARASDAYTLEALVTKNPERTKELKNEISSAWEEIDSIIAEIEKTDLTKEEINLNEQYKQRAQELANNRDKVMELAASNKNEEAYSLYMGAVEENRAAVNDILKEMQKYNLEHADLINNDNNDKKQEVLVFVAGIAIVVLLILVTLSIIITRMIVRPIKEVKGLLIEAENGDFTGKGNYESKDEIGELTASYNNMTNSLQAVFITVQDSSQQVASASEQLSASAEQNSNASEHITLTVQELASGSDKQLDTVENSFRVMKDITNHTKTISKHTEEITKDALQASTLSTEGNKAIQKVNEQMNSIYENVNSLSKAVGNLDARSNEISQITNVITGISAQTNLLALNAAIEAARAGEHGKGFAVVADEVRKLAEESTNSTEQISNLIQLIQNDTNLTLKTMEKAAEEVQSGLNVVNVAGSSFEKIEKAVNGVVSQIEDISDSLKKLSNGTISVNDSIENVSNVAQETSAITQNISAATQEQLASMEEITSSSMALAKLADDLQVIINQFKI
ncbi:methyl-accepting chemotaxis protein [Psychrobacillus psychrodurans]|uniref:methyl-accepting chemotaxis protein n=1 Tax=Psychrobacillus psychrodurans TaxID=126157 RepID=UPI001F4DD42D|nr:methyl-accepting chemotaxis protein [Psychrobacillus psychrodurans]MCK1998711.1 methyl-accepting chemotaxis protein [Psychrobacillus psychrodurans]